MTKMAAKCLKLIPYLWPKRLKNHTLWDRTYLYSLYKGVPQPGLVYFKNATWFTQKSVLFLYHCWSTITVSKTEESKDVATTRNWSPESAEKGRNRMWSRNDVKQWVVQLSAELPLSCVWSLRAMVYVVFLLLSVFPFVPFSMFSFCTTHFFSSSLICKSKMI